MQNCDADDFIPFISDDLIAISNNTVRGVARLFEIDVSVSASAS